MSETVSLHQSMMRRAKQQLAQNWGNAAIATLIFSVLFGAASFTYVGDLIVYGPLAFGYYLYLMGLTDTRQSDFNLLFRGFDRFGETLIAGLLSLLATSIGFALLIVPGIIVSLGFAMTFFIMAEDRNISGIDALKKSWKMMQGHKWDFFCLNLRFVGWILLACLTCGIGLLWVYPYMYVAYYNYYKNLRYGTF